MREIRLGDDVEKSDYKFLIRVRYVDDLKLGDVITFAGRLVYCQVMTNHGASYFSSYVKDETLYRVPRRDEQDKEPEVEIGECPIRARIKHQDEEYIITGHDEDGDVDIRHVDDEYGDCLYKHSKVLLISKGDQEILEAVCSSGEPKLGHIVELRKCQLEWTVEFEDDKTNYYTIRMFQGDNVFFHGPYASPITEDGKPVLVKLISKYPQPSDRNPADGVEQEFKSPMDSEAVTKWGRRSARIMDKRIADTLKSPMEYTHEKLGRIPDMVEEEPEEEAEKQNQEFVFPIDWLWDMGKKTSGLPDDVVDGMRHSKLDTITLNLQSVDFNTLNPKIKIIPDGKGGWKVEGT